MQEIIVESSVKSTEKKAHRNWTDEEKYTHYHTWKKSKLLTSNYCEKENIPLATFYKWKKHFETLTAEKPAELSFISVAKSTQKHAETQGMEVRFSNGLQCRFTQIVDMPLVVKLIRELNNVARY